ncbi:helix-turn-helix domain-containing protein [Streptomyces sp. NPDC059917]|uniref:helix-turn-helix domain-containing protein n=1 Tax=Streptomyces sp. NPDC059917 TaxID=3347002 RepID=UPI00364DEDA4
MQQSRAQHPLAVLRMALGLSHGQYAQLVADAHAALGYGRVLARREKVARWEGGRAVPTPTAQLAIARIHGVDEHEVTRLGWPHWLLLGTDDAVLLDGTWGPAAAARAAHATAVLGHSPRPGGREPAVTGSALRGQLHSALVVLGRPPVLSGQAGRPIPEHALEWAETRLRALEVQESGSPATAPVLTYAARAEHQLIAEMLDTGGYGAATASRLFYLGARGARLCSCLSMCLMRTADAERYALSALRCAVTAGSGRQAVAALATLGGIHAARGDPRDALLTIEAARQIPESAASTQVLDAWDALAQARLADGRGALRALWAAERAVDRAAPPEADSGTDREVVSPPGLDAMRVALCSGLRWLEQDQPRWALADFVLMTRDRPHRGGSSPFAPGVLLYVTEAQLSAGELDTAVHSAHRAIALAGSLPVTLAQEFRRLFAPYRDDRRVRDVLEILPRCQPEAAVPSQAPG